MYFLDISILWGGGGVELMYRKRCVILSDLIIKGIFLYLFVVVYKKYITRSIIHKFFALLL